MKISQAYSCPDIPTSQDENIVIDANFHVKIIDFGSAQILDPHKPAPFHQKFRGVSICLYVQLIADRATLTDPVFADYHLRCAGDPTRRDVSSSAG